MRQFLSTLSLRRATLFFFFFVVFLNYFYPRSPCGERPAASTGATNRDQISIHALLAESDALDISARRGLRISIHALLAESDEDANDSTNADLNFYPRSPCGERHQILDDISGETKYFYPRSPCGERQLSPKTKHKSNRISIHALLAESDVRLYRLSLTRCLFLSTLSLRRATSSGR